MRPRRQERISILLKQSISQIVESGLKTPFPGMITITNVKISPDAAVAWIDFTVLGADEASAEKYLRKSAKTIASQLAQKVRLRILPELRFSPDQTAKRALRIEQLIREINRNDH
jgi:ribosome-binding factor A